MGLDQFFQWSYGAPISRVVSPQLVSYRAIYRGPITPFITIVGPTVVEDQGSIPMDLAWIPR